MSGRLAFILFILLLKSVNVSGQIELNSDTIATILMESPAFTIFKDNYIISGTTIGENPTGYNSDIKFQVSFKQRLINRTLPYGFYSFLGYTQKTLWDIYVNSSPFAETNYNPGLFFVKPLFKGGYFNSSFILSLEHQSNGSDDFENSSRSWNYLAGNYNRAFNAKFTGSVKVWIPFGLKDNPDLMNYIGYGEAALNWVIKQDRWTTDIAVRKGAAWDWRGSFKIDLIYRPFKDRNQFIMLQWWNGYEETLIHYDNSRNMIRIGLALRPTFYRFF